MEPSLYGDFCEHSGIESDSNDGPWKCWTCKRIFSGLETLARDAHFRTRDLFRAISVEACGSSECEHRTLDRGRDDPLWTCRKCARQLSELEYAARSSFFYAREVFVEISKNASGPAVGDSEETAMKNNNELRDINDMPPVRPSAEERETKMFGCTVVELKAQVEKNVGEDRICRTKEDMAVSILSDVQELIAVGRGTPTHREFARQRINCVKWLLMEGK